MLRPPLALALALALALLLALAVARADSDTAGEDGGAGRTPARLPSSSARDREYELFCGAMDSQETCLRTRCCGWDPYTYPQSPCYPRVAKEDMFNDGDWTTVCVVTASVSPTPGTPGPTAPPTPATFPPTPSPVPTTGPPTASPTTKSPTAAPTASPTSASHSPSVTPTQAPTASKDAPPSVMLAVEFVATFELLAYETLDYAGFISSFQDDISRECPGVSRDDVVVRSITAGSSSRAMSSTVVDALVRFRDDATLTAFFVSASDSEVFGDWFITAYAPAVVAEVQPVAVLAPTDAPTRGPLFLTSAVKCRAWGAARTPLC